MIAHWEMNSMKRRIERLYLREGINQMVEDLSIIY
jgi:hypothetical protein